MGDLFGSEGTDAVKAEAEENVVFVADADVEAVPLDGDSAAVVSIAEGVDGRNER